MERHFQMAENTHPPSEAASRLHAIGGVHEKSCRYAGNRKLHVSSQHRRREIYAIQSLLGNVPFTSAGAIMTQPVWARSRPRKQAALLLDRGSC